MNKIHEISKTLQTIRIVDIVYSILMSTIVILTLIIYKLNIIENGTFNAICIH